MLLSNQALGLGCLTPESQVCPWTVVLQLIQLNGCVVGYFYLFDKHSGKLESIHRACNGCHTLDKLEYKPRLVCITTWQLHQLYTVLLGNLTRVVLSIPLLMLRFHSYHSCMDGH